MKLMTRYTRLFFWFLPPMLLAAWPLYFYKPNWLLDSTYVNWLALAVCFILVCSPWGSRLLISERYPRHPLQTSAWLLRTLTLQLGFWLFYLGMFALWNWHHPHDAPLPADAWRDPIKLTLNSFGLFPFASVALIATSFGWLAHRRHLDSYLDTLCFSEMRGTPVAVHVAMRAMGRGLTFGGLAFLSVIATLAIASLFVGYAKIARLLGLTLPSFATAFLLLVLCLRRQQSPLLTMVTQQRPMLSFILNVVVWSVIVTLIALIIPAKVGDAIALPNSIAMLISQHWHTYPPLFGMTTAWLLTPVMAITLARWSYGYTLRQLILVTLLPSAGLALALAQPWFPDPAAHAAAFTTAGYFLLLICLLPRSVLPLASKTYLAAGEIKHRSETVFYARWKTMTGALFYFFLPGGIVALGLVSSMVIIPCTLMIILMAINLLRSIHNTN